MHPAEGIPASARATQQTLTCHPHYAAAACALDRAETALTVLLMACAYIYFALYFYYLAQALLKLKDLPRQDHKITSLQIRLQARPECLPSQHAQERTFAPRFQST